MLESILDSKVKIKIAKLLTEEKEAMQVSDIARASKVSKSRASECLKELSEKGILESRPIGRSVVYKLASNNLAKTVSKFLAQDKTLLSEIEKSVVREAKKIKPISIALFGSALQGLKVGSDIDFLILYKGEIEKENFYNIASKLTEEFGFRISIMLMEEEEFKSKAKRGEEFVLNVLASHKLLYGKDLEGVVW